MKTNTLLTTAAIYLTLVGLGFLLAPGVMVFGALGGTPATIVALRWSCRKCAREWATTTTDAQPDRRSSGGDGRWSTADRRRAAV